jgi:hypothetical protein
VKADCPNCGAPIEFRFDDSFVRICDHCKHAVLRTDRKLSTLGMVADLAPIDSPIQLFSEGHFGKGTFLVVGMAQIRHSAGGIWQEWYAKLGGGTWGWLAESQGRYFLTFEEKNVRVPSADTLSPGAVVHLPVPGRPQPVPFTISELTTATYLGARGELPYRLEEGRPFRYADLSDGHGLVATIDYGDDPPSVYVGPEVSLADLKLSGGEPIAPEAPKISAKRIACPNCNAPVDIHLPGQSLRAVCSHCNTILGVGTEVAEIIAGQRRTAIPSIPLGAKGKLLEGEMTVVAFLQRSAYVEDTWWPFHEYLLHSREVGYRWLVESDGNWSYIQPVEAASVSVSVASATYEKVKFRAFQNCTLRVDEVYGEVYWLVEAGETVEGNDFIAPPAMLSREQSTAEVDWSLGTYMAPAQVKQAFAITDLPPPSTVAVNQVDLSARAANILSIAFGALLVLGIWFAGRASEAIKYTQDITIPAGTPPAPPPEPSDPTAAATPAPADTTPNPYVLFSDPFDLAGGKNIQFSFTATLNNDWAFIAADLVNVATGEVVDVDANLESYSGTEDGEYWSEGVNSSTTTVGPMPEGKYMLRVESQHGGGIGDVIAHVTVRQDVFRSRYLWMFIVLLGIPWFAFGLHAYMFERKRWEQSSFGKAGMPKNATWFAMLSIVGIGLIIVGIFKIFGSSSDD